MREAPSAVRSIRPVFALHTCQQSHKEITLIITVININNYWQWHERGGMDGRNGRFSFLSTLKPVSWKKFKKKKSSKRAMYTRYRSQVDAIYLLMLCANQQQQVTQLPPHPLQHTLTQTLQQCHPPPYHHPQPHHLLPGCQECTCSLLSKPLGL